MIFRQFYNPGYGKWSYLFVRIVQGRSETIEHRDLFGASDDGIKTFTTKFKLEVVYD
jgi:hypothetical protein